MFRKGMGQNRRKLEWFEVVTNCDRLPFFSLRQSKHEVFGKAVKISFDGLI